MPALVGDRQGEAAVGMWAFVVIGGVISWTTLEFKCECYVSCNMYELGGGVDIGS